MEMYELEAGQSPTIACLAAPLPACDQNQHKLAVKAMSLKGSKKISD